MVGGAPIGSDYDAADDGLRCYHEALAQERAKLEREVVAVSYLPPRSPDKAVRVQMLLRGGTVLELELTAHESVIALHELSRQLMRGRLKLVVG